LRPGRIDSIVELGIPDKKTREEIFKVHTRNMPLDKSIKILDYAKKTDGWTGADIEAICRNAGMSAIKRVYQSKKKEKLIIKKEDFEEGLKEVSKQIEKDISIKSKKEDKITKKKN